MRARLPTGLNLLRSGRITLLAALLAGAAMPAMAQAPLPADVQQRITAAAGEGPAALLRALEDVLRANPSLAATPDQASALARAAGAPVGSFVGSTLPIYRGITDRIVAAAPPAQEQAVRNAVAAELGRIAAAEVRPVPSGGQKPGALPQGEASREGQVAQRGFRVGSFIIYPDIQSAAIYDSNIYATRSQKRTDWIGTVSPKIDIESDWQRHSLTASVQTDLTGYAQHGHENTIDWNANVEGRIDATDTTQILLGATHIASHEDRSSPDAVDGYTPTPYRETSGYAGVLQKFGDVAVRVGGAVEHLEFDNVDSSHGVINNHDRDRNRITFGTLVRYEANPGFRPFVEALGDLRQYSQKVDDFGYARTSSGYRVGVGALFRISPSLRGDAFVGLMQRKADDARFQQITQVAFDGSLRWQAAPGTLLVLYTDRSIEESTLAGSPGYVSTVVGVRAEQKLTDSLTGLARIGWNHNDFLQSTRVDNEADASVGVRYRLTATWTLGLDYRFTQRNSNVPLAEYWRNEVYFRVGSSF